MRTLTRREFVKDSLPPLTAAMTFGGLEQKLSATERRERRKLPVAAVVTVYRPQSHADVVLGKILEGWEQKGGPGPDLKLVGLYVDQFPKQDMSRRLADKHGFSIFKTIREAITLAGDEIPVAGVLSIGEHGQYPSTPDTHQVMYPRRRFFDEIVETFRQYKKVVPVFSDKGLGFSWQDAKHMVDTACKMDFPMIAGSSIPVTWRIPPLELAMGCEIEEALALGYGGLEGYGFHSLELLQAVIERRQGGESGVAAVQVVQGDDIWKAEREGRWSRALLDAALATVPESLKTPGRPEDNFNQEAAFFLIEYRDGLKATVAMTNGHAGEFGFAAQLKGQSEPVATRCARQRGAPYAHHGLLLKATEQMIHTGKPSFRVERTLLTTGLLDSLMQSVRQECQRLETPHLKVKYQAQTWPYAKGVPPEPYS
ncbi:MAG: hypothetical protein ABGX16_04570 [Pirellulales bacterium]